MVKVPTDTVLPSLPQLHQKLTLQDLQLTQLLTTDTPVTDTPVTDTNTVLPSRDPTLSQLLSLDQPVKSLLMVCTVFLIITTNSRNKGVDPMY